MNPADLLDLVIDKAPRLRAAGVRMVELDGLRFEIDEARSDYVAPSPRDSDDDENEPDPLDDPATYGQRDYVPGFDLPSDEDEEQE